MSRIVAKTLGTRTGISDIANQTSSSSHPRRRLTQSNYRFSKPRRRKRCREENSKIPNTIGSNTKPVFTSGTAGGGGPWCGKSGRCATQRGKSPPGEGVLARLPVWYTNAPIATTNPTTDVIIQVQTLPRFPFILTIMRLFYVNCESQSSEILGKLEDYHNSP
jgi:hypothetical protein